MTQAEEIAAMKVEIKYLKDQVHDMNAKLDNLLALRYKGAGAFWLASALFGIVFTGLLAYLKGH